MEGLYNSFVVPSLCAGQEVEEAGDPYAAGVRWMADGVIEWSASAVVL